MSSTSEAEFLARRIVNELFKLGSDPTPCQRIQFMGGNWPDSEINQGGMNKDSLIRLIANTIHDKQP